MFFPHQLDWRYAAAAEGLLLCVHARLIVLPKVLRVWEGPGPSDERAGREADAPGGNGRRADRAGPGLRLLDPGRLQGQCF